MRLATLPLLLLGLLTLPPSARAEGDRDAVPYAAVRLSALSGIPDLVSLSATAYPWRIAAVEGGVGTLGLALTAHLRAGVALPLVDARDDEGAGPSVFLTPLLGYRYMESVPFDIAHQFHGINGVLALDGAWWLARHFGVGLQLAGGAAVWLAKTNPDAPPVVPDLRLSIGLMF